MTLSEIRTELTRLHLVPSKGMGQNFLHDQNMAHWIVEQAGVKAGSQVVEIGPGLGALTEGLVQSGCNLLAIEKDGRLAAHLQSRFPQERVQVLHEDALRFDPRRLYPGGPVTLVGNLPYYITSPVLFHFTSSASPVEQVIIMVQKELGRRLSAAPSTPEYGGLTLLLGRRWHVEYLRTLPPGLFFPAPKVESAVVRMTLRRPGELPACDGVLFDRLVKMGFSQRRKQLHKLLRQEVPQFDAIVAELRLDGRVRAEEMGLEQWVAFTRLVAGNAHLGAQDLDGEMFDVVDEEDRVTGSASRRSVHVNKLRHRAVHVLVFNRASEVLLQKRSPWKDHFPGRWDSSAAGHVDAGETYEECAAREVREELGVDAECVEVGSLRACEETGHEFVRIHVARHEGPFRVAPAEIEHVDFFPLELVKRWVRARPEDFAPGFRAVFQEWERSATAGAAAR